MGQVTRSPGWDETWRENGEAASRPESGEQEVCGGPGGLSLGAARVGSAGGGGRPLLWRVLGCGPSSLFYVANNTKERNCK